MDDLVAIARSWIGTPFHWGASVKGVGCDCKGLIAGVARDAGRLEAASVEALRMDYGEHVPCDALPDGLARLFDPVTGEWLPGDILLLNVGGLPRHLALYAGEGRMIHCYGNGPRQVIESPMGSVWKRATKSAWRFRDDG